MLYRQLYHIEQKIVMISDLDIVITILLCGIPILILIFLRTLKLKYQRDSCPRTIIDGMLFYNPKSITKRLIDIEEEQKLASTAFRQLTKIIDFLPDLDA